MLRADRLTVVHPDESTSEFTNVRYALAGGHIRVVTAGGDEKLFPDFDVFACYVSRSHGPGGIPAG